jgi:DNA-binding FadR family transcriptional regulator
MENMSPKSSTNKSGAGVGSQAARDGEAPETAAESPRLAAGFAPRTKLAERVAAEIETRIIRKQWPTGHVIGSEAELLETYGVSRAVLREAIRILEHQSIAAMRKGPGGGLVVEEPSATVVSRAIAVYFRHHRVDPSQLLDVRIAIESTMLRLVHAQMSQGLAAKLRRHLKVEEREVRTAHHSLHHFHLMLAKVTRNRGIELFVQCLVMLTDVQSSEAVLPAHKDAEKLHAAHVQVAEALIRGDLDESIRAMSEHVRSLEKYMARIPPAAGNPRIEDTEFTAMPNLAEKSAL